MVGIFLGPFLAAGTKKLFWIFRMHSIPMKDRLFYSHFSVLGGRLPRFYDVCTQIGSVPIAPAGCQLCVVDTSMTPLSTIFLLANFVDTPNFWLVQIQPVGTVLYLIPATAKYFPHIFYFSFVYSTGRTVLMGIYAYKVTSAVACPLFCNQRRA